MYQRELQRQLLNARNVEAKRQAEAKKAQEATTNNCASNVCNDAVNCYDAAYIIINKKNREVFKLTLEPYKTDCM